MLSYDPEILRVTPDALLTSFSGVGNPFSLGKVFPGAAVLDFGCGAGFDLFVASRFTGENGRICGLELTEEMAEKGRQNLLSAGLKNFEIKTTDSDTIPYHDDSFDIILSNGAINLCPDKPRCFGELYRVLKRGGKIQYADVVLEGQLPPSMAGPESWAQ